MQVNVTLAAASTVPTVIDRASPMHLMMAVNPKKEG